MECIEVVESLSQKEKNSILHVMQRDEKLREGHDQKIKNLKNEIQLLRMRSVLRAGDDQEKMCIRCRQQFGFIFNRGAICPLCHFKVCKMCQEVMFNGSWLCALCYRQRQLKWLSGEWASYEQNPLRKWASGTDIARASMSLAIGTTSIDIDESPTHSSASTNNNKSRKPARNGVANSDQEKQRVEYPKESDQLKLSQLFDVLRTKKPEEPPAETQVRRITSRRYSESDSDSSSSSDLEAHSLRSSPNAPSVTESELDARRLDSPPSFDTSPQSGIESPRSFESQRRLASSELGTNETNERERKGGRPKASPRSPKPAARTKVKSDKDAAVAPRPKARTRARESGPEEKDTLKVDSGEEAKFTMSRSVDVNLGSDLKEEVDQKRKAVSNNELNLQMHVARTKESLDQKSRSQNALDEVSKQDVSSDKSLKSESKEKVKRKSGESLSESPSRNTRSEKDVHSKKKGDRLIDLVQRSDNQKDARHEKVEVQIEVNPETSSLDRDVTASLEKERKSNQKDPNEISDSVSNGFEQIPNAKDDYGISIQVPRTGSPYSFSMDSLPSSHPSPSLRHHSIGDSSLVESSDTDSLSRLSHHELGENSGTESQIREGSEEEFDVEAISKVRFQRVTKKVTQLGAMAKIKSPKRKKLPGIRDSPQTISECSTVSQDDSGHVSGGSRGNTPEHKRTDSSYSQSSIPSTLSTVTDRSEEDEDIDKVVASLPKTGSRGNLLSVIADSRESICSYYSDAGDVAYSKVPVTGDILFGVNYNYKTSMLEIAIKQCRDIAVADTRRNRSDPYVKTYLLPDKTRSGKRKTKVKKHTVNPTFEETLKYSISKSELENRTLWVTIWHNDRFGRNVFLGEVTINFDYYKFNDPCAQWYPLEERNDSQPSSMMVYKGDLSICIKYVPGEKMNASPSGKGKQKKETSMKGQLHVMVREARNLTAVRSNGFSDPFCKGYLLPERHKSSKQKTSVIKKDCNPTWNHTFIFEDVSLMELRERCLELTIWDYEKLSSNDFLGGVRLNLGTGMSQGKPVDWMDARGEEMSMWQAMLDRPNLWIDGALILRPNMDKRKF